ncbi:unnamed protein product, partial [Closterium sp. NIES-53]
MDWEMSVDEILRLAGFSEGNCTSSCQKLHTFQLAWVNAAVRQMWPELSKASTHMLRSSLQGLFEGYHFGVITGIDVQSVDLGPDPPTITGALRGLFKGYHFGIITGIDVRSVDLDQSSWCRASTEILQSSLRGLFAGYHLDVITGIDVRSVDLGSDPPTITGACELNPPPH